MRINVENAQTERFRPLQGDNITNLSYLSYSNNDCSLYAIQDRLSEPKLVRIDLLGNVELVGKISLDNANIFLCESISYSENDEQLYAAVSLDGGLATNDSYSESLIRIDVQTAQATLVGTLEANATIETDMDKIEWQGDKLYILDGRPGDQSVFYSLDYSALGTILSPTKEDDFPYLQSYDLSADDADNIYFTTVQRRLMQYNTTNPQINLVGQTHSSAQFSGKQILGLDFVPFEKYSFNIDTTICDDAFLKIKLPSKIKAKWNDGLETNKRVIQQASELYFLGLEAGCPIYSDTIQVKTKSCDTCGVYKKDIEDQLQLFIDTTICKGDDLQLRLNIKAPYEVLWNTGSQLQHIDIFRAGQYWADIRYETCIFTTDTMQLDVMDCEPCDIFIPNVFTPNNDGINDVFKAYISDSCQRTMQIKCSIFDHWGNKVYESMDNAWDGKLKNQDIQSGVYTYLFEITTTIRTKQIRTRKTGTVSIIR